MAASQPPQLTAASAALGTLMVHLYAAQPMQVSLVGGFWTLGEMM